MNKGRYESQALLDERALLTCMAYVDLNPIRAALTKTLQGSDYTSVQARISATRGEPSPLPLVPFQDQPEATDDALSYYLRHYLELVDWTGRAVRDDKRGAIPPDIESVLETLGFDEATWLEGIKLYGRPIFKVIGPSDRMRTVARTHRQSWYRGLSACHAVFGPT